MLLETLEEFYTLAALLNYTKAADELHVSQTTLSRHIKSMEVELGFSVIEVKNNQLYVTRAGNELLNGVVPLLRNYTNLVERCRRIDEEMLGDLTIQEPPFQDSAGMHLLKTIHQFKSDYPGIAVHYREIHSSLFDNIRNGTVDVALEYRYSDTAQLQENYREEGFDIARICRTPIMVYFNAESSLASKEMIEVEDILDYSVLCVYDSFSPSRAAIEELFLSHGREPKIRDCAVSSMLEFYTHPVSIDEIMLLPEGMQDNRYVSMQEGTHTKLLSNQYYDYIAVFKEGVQESRALQLFSSFLRSEFCANYA